MPISPFYIRRCVDILSLPFTGSVVPRASRFMVRSPQETQSNESLNVGSSSEFVRAHETENGMKGESNAFRRESSDSSSENEPKERDTGNAFSIYGFSRCQLGVLRNQVCPRKTMNLSLNMLPMNKECHSICHLFPRFVTINMPPTRKVFQIKGFEEEVPKVGSTAIKGGKGWLATGLNPIISLHYYQPLLVSDHRVLLHEQRPLSEDMSQHPFHPQVFRGY
ncbi:hypothetical protein GQ457_05G020530 [Hibiscus cannabinus]